MSKELRGRVINKAMDRQSK